MKDRLAKICPLLSFAVYGVLFFMRGYLFLFPPCDPDFSKEWEIFIILLLFGWIPSLIFSVLGIVFSSRVLKDGGKKIFLILSLVNFALSVAWATFILLNLIMLNL
ncbi:MAG: hypothetical protein IJ530_03875 [Treponema sp.]|uniref:hypothetical protein n=1 Tax=Treponema sp. TaxID=166 RepID=UPI0025CD092C|nr:hypothetical protein [Treponema sp.]MBQ8678883.1 hypothetical protein [Treponema sp.]